MRGILDPNEGDGRTVCRGSHCAPTGTRFDRTQERWRVLEPVVPSLIARPKEPRSAIRSEVPKLFPALLLRRQLCASACAVQERNGAPYQGRSRSPDQGANRTAPGRRPFSGHSSQALLLFFKSLAAQVGRFPESRNLTRASFQVVFIRACARYPYLLLQTSVVAPAILRSITKK